MLCVISLRRCVWQLQDAMIRNIIVAPVHMWVASRFARCYSYLKEVLGAHCVLCQPSRVLHSSLR